MENKNSDSMENKNFVAKPPKLCEYQKLDKKNNIFADHKNIVLG